MVLPNVRVQWISDEKGYGLFATKFIPKGTITFVQDDLDIVIPQKMVNTYSPAMKQHIEKYSYLDFSNNHIISWDLGKYMNHCCFANTLSTGYGFEIAVEDIKEGEEITDDYRIFTVDHQLIVNCKKIGCVGKLSFDGVQDQIEAWDNKIRPALKNFRNVDQHLAELIDPKVLQQIDDYIANDEKYISVAKQLPTAKINL